MCSALRCVASRGAGPARPTPPPAPTPARIPPRLHAHAGASASPRLPAAQIPFTLVFTKIDKRKKGCPPPEENAAAFESALRATWGELPPALATSSRSGAGKKELLAHVAQLRQLWAQAQAAAGAQG